MGIIKKNKRICHQETKLERKTNPQNS